MHTPSPLPPVSCLPVSLYPDFESNRMTVDQWAEIAQTLGLDAIDINVPILRRLTNRPSFRVDTVAAYTDFTHPDATVREHEFRSVQEDLRRCADIGAAYLRITAGQAHPETPRKQGLDWAASFFRKTAEAAAGHGVGLLYENHSTPGAWRHADFAAEPDIYRALLARLDGTGIDLLFDTANACFYRQNPVQMIEGIFPRVKRIHVADIVPAETLRPVRIGKGLVPFIPIFKFLRENQFAGALSIEEASFEGVKGIEKAARSVRALWRDACTDQENTS